VRALSAASVAAVLFLHPALLPAVTLGEETEAFLNVIAVAGREAPAADFIAERLAGLPTERDAPTRASALEPCSAPWTTATSRPAS